MTHVSTPADQKLAQALAESDARLDQERREIEESEDEQLERIGKRIDRSKAQGVAVILEIGEQLSAAHDLLAGAGRDGEFRPWVERRCYFSLRTAYRYRDVHRRFAGQKCATVAHFEQSALYALAKETCPQAAVDKALELAEAGQIVTKATAEELISGVTLPPDEDLSTLDRIRAKLEDDTAERLTEAGVPEPVIEYVATKATPHAMRRAATKAIKDGPDAKLPKGLQVAGTADDGAADGESTVDETSDDDTDLVDDGAADLTEAAGTVNDHLDHCAAAATGDSSADSDEDPAEEASTETDENRADELRSVYSKTRASLQLLGELKYEDVEVLRDIIEGNRIEVLKELKAAELRSLTSLIEEAQGPAKRPAKKKTAKKKATPKKKTAKKKA